MDKLFDKAGNLITERPESKTIDGIPEKIFKCQFCEFVYDTKSARAGHERWCDNNPKRRKTNPLESIKKEVFYCQFCEQEWDTKASKVQHERWCKKNPNPRQYRNKRTKIKEPEKKKQEKAKLKSKNKILKGIDIIKELREFDKTFGLTDDQIVKYIRDKIDHDKM